MSNIWFSPETATISGGGAEGNRDEITSSVVVKIHRCIIKLNISQISNKYVSNLKFVWIGKKKKQLIIRQTSV